VELRSFEPAQRLFGARINKLRRMHRKRGVVDARRACVGGLNYSIDHLDEHGPLAKQDYATSANRCGGPACGGAGPLASPPTDHTAVSDRAMGKAR
jgi:hypothetical protein